MYLTDVLSRCLLSISLAVLCALMANPVVQAGAGRPDQPTTEGAVKELFRTEPPTSDFYVISPDSRKLALGQVVPAAEGKPSRAELVLLDLVTGKELSRRRVDSPIYGGVFSPDGKLLAVGSPFHIKEKFAAIWDIGRWEPKVQLKRPERHGVGCPLAFSPDGKFVAGRALRQKPDPWYTEDLIIWDVATGACRVLEDSDAKRFRPIQYQSGFSVRLVGKDGPDKGPATEGPILGPAPIAVSFPDPPFSDRLFVEYHALFPSMPLQSHVFTTLWDTKRGKPLRTELYRGGELPFDARQYSLAGRGDPLPGSSADLFRFRTTPSGRILYLPKYHRPPIIPVADENGTIALAVAPIERQFGLINPWPSVPFTELCRLEDYKDKDPADRGLSGRTCRLSPDGRRLVAVGIDPQTVKTKNPVNVLRVWDVSALHPLALKKMEKLGRVERERFWGVLFEDQAEGDSLVNGLCFPFRWYEDGLRAMYSLVLHGDDAVAWLRKKMGPPTDVTEAPRLIEDLESPKFEARERATRKLDSLGQAARPFLKRALAKDPPPETKKRAGDLLDKLRETAAAYELRKMRIIDVLEHINTAPARALLKQIADGKHDPTFAEEAERALQRATQKKSNEEGTQK
jgi:WD40 repeat protein